MRSPSMRGKGVAALLLKRLEDEARAAGETILRLETGIHQHEALRFYEKAGFRRCDAFGAYLEKPPHSIATSVFFEKSALTNIPGSAGDFSHCNEE